MFKALKYIKLLCAIALAAPVAAQMYIPGEVLEYRVSYNAKLIPNWEMGQVTVTTSDSEHNGVPTYLVQAVAKTLPNYTWFFDMEDVYTIQVDKQSQKPIHFESNLKEGDYTFKSKYDYMWDSLQIKTWWQIRDREPQSKQFEITEKSLDAISLFFSMRNTDPDSFSPGEIRSMDMVLEDTVRTINYRYIKREKKKIRRLGTFNTLRFECQLGTSQGYSFTDGTIFTIWVSDDKNKVPLLLESPVSVGRVQAYLVGYRNLKYPLSSQRK